VLLLVAVLVPGVGTRVKGAQRWIRLLGWSLQPSELAKLSVPLMMAWLVERRRAALAGWWSGTVPVLWPLALTLPLILIQPDLGTTLFVLGGGLLVLYASGWPATNFLFAIVAFVPLALAQRGFDAVQGKVAWNKAGNTNWNAANIRSLCQGTINPSKSISCFKTVIALFDDYGRGLKECTGLAISFGYASYDSNPYKQDTSRANNWEWVGGKERTIYNPLDGGVLLKYTMNSQGNADGCSAGVQREKTLFQQACFAHDTNHDAPFPLAGFPGYPNGGSTGQDISDYLFYKDMQLIVENGRAKNDAAVNFVNDSAAAFFYTAVVLGGQFRGRSEGKSVLAKGGVVAVMNAGIYVMTLRVKWTAPDGTRKTAELSKPAGQTAVIPLSIGAKNIEVECWAVGGTTIFTKKYDTPGMYAFTVGGTTLINNFEAGLKNDVRNDVNSTFKGKDTPEGERTIKFSHQAGYVAEMVVTYFAYQNISGTMTLMPKFIATEKITAGVSRSIVIPKDILKATPIQVSIRGYGTFKNDVFSTTVPTDFTGELCYKAWGSFGNPQGGKCN